MKIGKILRVHINHSRYDFNNQDVLSTEDTVGQKLALQIAKQRKYKLSAKRRTNNDMFKRNEKRFYQNIMSSQVVQNDVPLNIQNATSFWASIWKRNPTPNEGNWIEEEEKRYQEVLEMNTFQISLPQLKEVLKKLHNWKSPGLDQIQNFWLKKLSSVHEKLHELLYEAIDCPDKFPSDLIIGTTYLLPKGSGFNGSASNSRPITCLSTIYKIVTACLNQIIMSIFYQMKFCVKSKKVAKNN